MRTRVASIAVALLVAACGQDGPSASGTPATETANVGQPASSVAMPDPHADDQPELDGGRGGLAFDAKLGRFVIPDSGPPEPRPLRPDVPLPVDDMLRDDQAGVVLELRFHPRAVPAPPKAPEVDVAGIAAASKLTAAVTTATITALGRLKWTFNSRAMPLPFHSELRARYDRIGNLVMWPGGERYRVVAGGALRATIGERRVDVTPTVGGTPVSRGTGKRLDLPTRTVTLESAVGRIHLELATVPESGLGGPLLCRALVELAGIDPMTTECKPEELVLFAGYDWQGGGGIEVEVTAMERRTDLRPGDVLVPPPGAELAPDGLPEATDGVFLTQPELAAMRTKAVDVTHDTNAPIDGFLVDNGRDYAMTFWLDGVPVVSVPALDKRLVLGALRGHYVGEWRTFLGDKIEEPFPVDLPALIRNYTPKTDAADAGPP